jgi:Fur family transcriptional regulator, zinc uptake regulator
VLYRSIVPSTKPHNHAHAHDHSHEPHRAPDRAIAAGIAFARAQVGDRLTDTRELVLRILLEENKPMTAYELLDILGSRTGRARNPPTIYRALEFLLEEGFISRLESLNAYTVCSHLGEQHMCLFFLCNCCGVATEVTDPEIEARLMSAAASLGFRSEGRTVEVDGLCKKCHSEHGGVVAQVP